MAVGVRVKLDDIYEDIIKLSCWCRHLQHTILYGYQCACARAQGKNDQAKTGPAGPLNCYSLDYFMVIFDKT